jgi:hypothetical protein
LFLQENLFIFSAGAGRGDGERFLIKDDLFKISKDRYYLAWKSTECFVIPKELFSFSWESNFRG